MVLRLSSISELVEPFLLIASNSNLIIMHHYQALEGPVISISSKEGVLLEVVDLTSII
jgi:hypothetical protein